MPFIKNTVINKSRSYLNAPPPVPAIIVAIDGGYFTSHFISGSTTTFSWGINGVGQLGDNTIVSKNTPITIVGQAKTFCEISTNNNSAGNHVLAIDKNGRVWAWGNGANGRLGDNTIVNKSTPVAIAGAVKTFCHISVGNTHSVGIDKNGRAWGWGNNSVGHIGDNTVQSKRTPVAVAGATKTFCKIYAAAGGTSAIDKNGRAWGWGNNTGGRIGNNSILSARTPVAVLGATKTFCEIGSGNQHTVAIDKNGKLWAWGGNPNGQLGDNTITSKLTPISIVGSNKTFCKISTGDNFTLAIDKNGKVWGWGQNSSGQLGDNTTVDKSTPVAVGGINKTFCEIGTGFNHSLAIDKYGKVWAWGGNNNGQIGNNTIVSVLTPVRVCKL